MTGPSESPRRSPTLTVGLPVYNGERYLGESLDALLAQTYSDFELIISDNASTDATPDICRRYAERDPRIRVIRQSRNIGAGPNHNILPREARGKYFKWASHDDLYHPELLQRCVEVLDSHPECVLAHAWDAIIDVDGAVIEAPPYTMQTDSPSPRVRLRSLLYGAGGNDFYGVIRTDVLRYVREHGSYFNADRTFTASLALHGPFYQVPEVLYFRRDHAGRATRAGGKRARAAVLDTKRADRLRHPMLRMYVEYIFGYLVAIRRAPLSFVDRVGCLFEVASWAIGHAAPSRRRGRSGPAVAENSS
jgi:glycosyltransferase involved in cell wall biosynthesis